MREDKKKTSANQTYSIASPFGMSLVFLTREQLEQTIENLQGLLEWGEESEIEPPYVYHVTHEGVPFQEAEKWGDWIKYIFAISGDE